MLPHEGDQFELWESMFPRKVEEPWRGQSPRVLTAGYKRFTLKAQAEKSVSDFVSDERQYDLWLPIERAPWVYQGAPFLLGRDENGEQ